MLIVRRKELIAAGYEPDEVRQRLRSGELVKIRPGAYVGDALPRAPEERHRLAVRAAAPDLAAEAVISHVSAAVLRGLPTWGIALDRVHATRPRRSGARRGRVVHLHAAPLDPREIAQVDGIAVTSPARTVVDIARSVPFEQGVVLADRALHSGLVDAASLTAALEGAVHRPGCPAARRALRFADGRSESVGESRSRTAIAAAGLPAPVLQWDVRTPGGTRLGRADFGWPQQTTVGEFDGRIKYSRQLHPHTEAGDVVFAEKRREDALRDAGLPGRALGLVRSRRLRPDRRTPVPRARQPAPLSPDLALTPTDRLDGSTSGLASSQLGKDPRSPPARCEAAPCAARHSQCCEAVPVAPGCDLAEPGAPRSTQWVVAACRRAATAQLELRHPRRAARSVHPGLRG